MPGPCCDDAPGTGVVADADRSAMADAAVAAVQGVASEGRDVDTGSRQERERLASLSPPCL